ncbi:oxygenase MpaB family protein [Roseivirga sp. E12]|uniref:oxygenase MpaB family protein n=1 Tax=Roseivirga sp. E12 TaxID=2819237 RepID=UPI001ABD362A|nr:oxygenase MpaB family protein [Roseivirga sp. E12]MBO3697477.1 DUF2236 domain-containing protein [Roseivirga sp. E12]
MELHTGTWLDAFRELQDPLADRVIAKYFPAHKDLLQSHLASLGHNEDALPEGAFDELHALYLNITSTASKFDEEELLKGQDFFNVYASDIMLLLGFLSLPYCYTAAYGAEVLVKSKRILDDPARRLMDTAGFVFDVTNKKAFKPEGNALISILNVRLLHSVTRWYISQSGDWNDSEKGKPINQEDMAGTNLSFSLIAIRGLRKLGRFIEPRLAYDYINYWNKIGLLLGLDPRLLPDSNKDAFQLEKDIRTRHFRTSEAGVLLTDSLYRYYEKAVIDSPLEGLTKPFMIHLLGDKVARQLGLEVSNYDRLVFKPYQLFLNFRNYFFDTQDSYAKAYARFKENSLDET